METGSVNYRVLYRRFRPQRFDEIVGQDHIIPILKNQIRTGNISHAYLFSGPRGTGKTSAAKVFARAVNCLDPQDGEPCGRCASCTSGEDQAFTNVTEIDAASNRSIDDIRRLRDEVNFLPVGVKYRVYIIDEVHMLTNEAFNALLKTLEEPPEHIIFIFATTEIYKVLPTIISRCQRYDFRRISGEKMRERLSDALSGIGVPCEKGALDMIVAASDGALRDAWSLTDKVLAASEDGTLSESAASAVLGMGHSAGLLEAAEAVSEGDAGKALDKLGELIDSGMDEDDILTSFTEYFRSLMILKNVSDYDKMLFKSEGYILSLKRSALTVSDEDIISYMAVLGDVRVQSRGGGNMRYALETAVLRMCDKDRLNENISLKARIEKLEKRVEALASMPREAPQSSPRASEILRRAGIDAAPRPEAAKPAEQDMISPAEEPPAKATGADKVKDPVDTPLTTGSGTDEDDIDIPEEFAVSPDDKDVLADIAEHLAGCAEYINNQYRDQYLWSIVSDLKPLSFDGDTLTVYPTGVSVHMMGSFDEHNGPARLSEALKVRTGREIKIAVTSPPQKNAKKKDNIELARELLGGLEEIK
ncbi:MAG: DNA polymerase III subunit gamma/tau [Eubacteriaceae bacterium]|nr:DNA polymerase III subunit gamma/tau [Eubacteriaceae bacterium]